MIETFFYIVECPRCCSQHLKCDVFRDGELMFQVVMEFEFFEENLAEQISMLNRFICDMKDVDLNELSKTEQEQ